MKLTTKQIISLHIQRIKILLYLHWDIGKQALKNVPFIELFTNGVKLHAKFIWFGIFYTILLKHMGVGFLVISSLIVCVIIRFLHFTHYIFQETCKKETEGVIRDLKAHLIKPVSETNTTRH